MRARAIRRPAGLRGSLARLPRRRRYRSSARRTSTPRERPRAAALASRYTRRAKSACDRTSRVRLAARALERAAHRVQLRRAQRRSVRLFATRSLSISRGATERSQRRRRAVAARPRPATVRFIIMGSEARRDTRASHPLVLPPQSATGRAFTVRFISRQTVARRLIGVLGRLTIYATLRSGPVRAPESRTRTPRVNAYAPHLNPGERLSYAIYIHCVHRADCRALHLRAVASRLTPGTTAP